MTYRDAYAESLSEERLLRLRYAGEEACESGHRYGGVRDHFLMHYVLEGEGRVRVGGRTASLGKGGLFLFFPGQEHLYRASAERPWRYAWVGFEGSGAEAALEAAGIVAERSVVAAPYSPELASLLRRAADELAVGGRAAAMAGDGVLRLILSRLRSVVRGPEAPASLRLSRSDYVSTARRFIEEHFERPIRVGDVVRTVGLDREYLSSLFKEETGTTMKALLTELRMERAKRLLLEGRLTVSQVASSVGYRDYAVFERAFSAAAGLAPRSFARGDEGGPACLTRIPRP